jgi:hypothetical protein
LRDASDEFTYLIFLLLPVHFSYIIFRAAPIPLRGVKA